MNATLKELVQDRKELKRLEKEYYDYESPICYLEAHKLRKKIEKAIFKILENDING